MTDDARLADLLGVIAKALGVTPEQVSRDTDGTTLAAWDSLGQVQVILAVEEHFDVRFRTGELGTLASVRALADRLGIVA